MAGGAESWQRRQGVQLESCDIFDGASAPKDGTGQLIAESGRFNFHQSRRYPLVNQQKAMKNHHV